MPKSRGISGGLTRGRLFDTNIKATQIDEDIFSDQTLLSTIAGDDLVLVLDVSETPDKVKYITRTNFIAGIDTVTVTDNESTNENNLIAFVADAATSSGAHGLEMDGDLTYNPSTGTLTTTILGGTLSTVSQPNVTTLAGVTTMGAVANALALSYSDATLFHDANNADLSFTMGTSATEALKIEVLNGGSNKTAESIAFTSTTASGTGDHGKFTFSVDEATAMFTIDDGGVSIAESGAYEINGTAILSDSSGTLTLQNVDALDATTESTIEAALDTLSNLASATGLTTIGAAGATTNVAAGDVTFFNPVNNGNPTLSLGSDSNERLIITSTFDSGAQTLDKVTFQTAAASSSGDKGKYVFNVDGTDIFDIDDSGINLASGKTFRVSGGTVLGSVNDFSAGAIADGDSFIFSDADDSNATKKEAIADLATLFAGTGLTAASSAIGVDASQTQITAVGTLTGLALDGNKNVTPGDGAMIHLDTSTITDNNTSGSGTASLYTHVRFEAPTLAASNSSVTTTTASTVYISGAPAAGTNQTITNGLALFVDAGNVRFDGEIIMGTNTAGNLLIADGTDFSSTAVGDLSEISSVANDDVLLAVDTSGGGLKKIARSTLVAGLATSSAIANVVDDSTPQLGGSLDVNGEDIVSVSGGNITLTPNGSGVVRVDGSNGIDMESGSISIKNSGSESYVRFYCESSNAHYTQLQAAPHSAYSGNVTVVLPATADTLVGRATTDTLTNKTFGDNVDIFEDANNADVTLRMGTSATESLAISVLNGGSNKTAESVTFTTATASSTGDHGKFTFNVDGTDIFDVDDSGINLASGKTFRINGTAISSATITALNNATENELVTIGSTTTELDAEAALTFDGTDLKLLKDANNADVSFVLGTADAESLTIQVLNGGSNKTAEEVHFSTATASSTGDHGKMVFDVDGTDILTIDDGGIDIASGKTVAINGTDIVSAAGAITGITSLLATDIKIGEDDETKIDFETADEIHFYANNVEQVYLGDNIFGPQSDSDVDLGSSSVRWKDAYVDSVTSTGAISGSTGTYSGILKTDDGTDATSTTDGSLQTDGGLSVAKDAVIGNDLLMLSDSSVIKFGANSEVTLTHDHDAGLALKHTATADDKPIILTLQTGETDIAANDVLGAIRFQAPDEGTDTDSRLVAAAIQAVSEGDFAADANATRLEFHTGASEAAAVKMTLSSAGVLDVDGGITIDNLIMDGTTIGHADDTDLMTLADGLLTVAGEISVTTLDIGGTNVGSTAGELNLLDGSAKSTSSITIADADAFIVIDGSTTKQIPASDIKTYAAGSSATKGFATAMAIAL